MCGTDAGATSNPTVTACLARARPPAAAASAASAASSARSSARSRIRRARVLASQAHAAFAAASHSPASALVAAARCAKSSLLTKSCAHGRTQCVGSVSPRCARAEAQTP